MNWRSALISHIAFWIETWWRALWFFTFRYQFHGENWQSIFNSFVRLHVKFDFIGSNWGCGNYNINNDLKLLERNSVSQDLHIIIIEFRYCCLSVLNCSILLTMYKCAFSYKCKFSHPSCVKWWDLYIKLYPLYDPYNLSFSSISSRSKLSV